MHNPFDHLAKKVGKGALDPSGVTVIQDEISRDAQHADLRHEPDPEREEERARIGLLGRIASVLCLIEMYGHAPGAAEFRACLGKYIAFWEQRAAVARKAAKVGKKGEQAKPFADPFLWIITAGRPAGVLAALKFTRARGWPKGVYVFGHDVLRVGIIVGSELPRNRSTLLVRLMAGGRLLGAAIEDLAALPPGARERAVAEPDLLRLQQQLGKKPGLTPEEEEFIVTMQTTWEQARDQGRDEGRDEGRGEGQLLGVRSSLRRVLAARKLIASRAEEARIDGCTDIATLEHWLDRALTARSVAEVLQGGAARSAAGPRRRAVRSS